MKAIGALTPVILVLGLAVHAQDTATMTSPVIRTDADEIQFTVDFANFAPDGDYRLEGECGFNLVGAQIRQKLGDRVFFRLSALFGSRRGQQGVHRRPAKA